MFTPLKPTQAQSITTTGSKKGVNLRDNPQMINVDFAQTIDNWQTLADGRLTKVKGLREYLDLGEGVINFFIRWGKHRIAFSIGTNLYIYDLRDNSTLNIKDDWASSNLKGIGYGEYFFCGSEEDVLLRFEERVNISNLAGSIQVGEPVYSLDGVQRTVHGNVSSVESGYFVIKNINGSKLESGMSLDFSNGAQCDVDSIEIVNERPNNSPYVDCISLIGTRLYVGDNEEVKFSNIDSGSNPPFDLWATNTSADGAGQISFKRAGKVLAIAPLGQFIVVFQENGKFAFQHQTIDSGGVLKRLDLSNVNRLDDGGSTAVLTTPQGIFYLNEAGLWQLTTLGVENTPYSEQDVELTLLLGADYFDNLNLDARPDIMYDAATQTVFVTYAIDSDSNNEILAYRTEYRSTTFIKNWSIQSFYVDGRNFYGTSSVDGKVYELFKGYEVNDLGIRSRYVQEIQTGDLTTRKDLLGIELGCNLSEGSDLKISFDIHDENGRLVENVVRLNVENSYSLIDLEGHYDLGFGGAWGGVEGSSQLIPQLLDSNVRIRNYQRLIVKIEDFSKAPCEINYLRLKWREKSQIRKRKITKV